MKVGVKFCGGCNPRYERRKFLEEIANHFKGHILFEMTKEQEIYDVLLVIGGCSNCCANYQNLRYKKEVLFSKNKEDQKQIIEEIYNIYRDYYE
ncbi:hypothetical protein [Inediibacterium massiliense]|uniref:hypothetical protein n=1 Tax=Inediibacterium massiliense TaxID=1658111 RepID=UPI0006B5AF50|nr:hypothetical protein [Inediibacterium massiliense]